MIRDQVEGRRYRIAFLPPYSPQLNPIEEVFSKWKGRVRGSGCNNNAELLNAISHSSEQITSEDCAGFFAHMRMFISRALERREF
jgi:transposase